MRDVLWLTLLALVFSAAAVGCVESDDTVDDIDRDPSQVDSEPQNTPQETPEVLRGTPGEAVPDEAGDEDRQEAPVEQTSGDESRVQVQLLAGKQPNHPAAWLAHAAANESECGHTSCPFTVVDRVSEPEAIPPFERGEECMLEGGVVVEGGESYVAEAEAGAARASFATDVSSGEDFVELTLSGQSQAEIPTEGGVRSDAGATLYTDETGMVLDIVNPGGEPVELEVSWDLSGQPERGEASWQGSLWYTGNASRLDECYVAPDYQYDRIFDVFQDVGGAVRGDASGTVRVPIANQEHNQVGLRLNVGAHAVGREGSRPELAQSSASQVEGTVRFRVVSADEPAEPVDDPPAEPVDDLAEEQPAEQTGG